MKACYVFACIVHISSISSALLRKAHVSIKKWWFLGPFLTGKTEIDADVLEQYPFRKSLAGEPCTRSKIIRKEPGCPSEFLSEIATKGYVGWTLLPLSIGSQEGDHIINIQFPFPNATIHYNGLIQGLNKMTVLEFQGWITSSFTIKSEGMFIIRCPGIHSLFLDDVLLHGDIYSAGAFQPVYLLKGKHNLDIRIRAKATVQFRFSIEMISATGDTLRLEQMRRGNELTDILDGHFPFGQTTWIQLPVSNVGDAWVAELSAVVISSDTSSSSRFKPSIVVVAPPIDELGFLGLPIAPMHTTYFAFQLTFIDSKNNQGDDSWWRDFTSKDDPCLHLQVQVQGCIQENPRELIGSPSGSCTNLVSSNSITLNMRCRHSLQSFLFTFLDHDGSVSHAAAIQPRKAQSYKSLSGKTELDFCRRIGGCPVVLSLSGVGVATRSQADSYKYKKSRTDKDYTFGYEEMWILAPARDGAHNWEGTGYWTARAALEYLLKASAAVDAGRLQANPSRIVLSGHSRGGHAVLTLGTHLPDQFKALATASGYPDRESYGDANILFDLDLQLAYMDPLLIAVHLAALHEHDNMQTSGNLKGQHVLVRAGSEDRTVNPFFQRAIARVLEAQQANVTYSEKPGADHWYWDFETAEDGGVVFDPLTRTFLSDHAFELEASAAAIRSTLATDRSNFPRNNPAGRIETALVDGFTVESWNPATFESVHGIRILAMILRLKKSVVEVLPVPSSSGQRTSFERSDGTVCTWHLSPSNVEKFVVTSDFWERFCGRGDGGSSGGAGGGTGGNSGPTIQLGDQTFPIDDPSASAEFCLSAAAPGGGVPAFTEETPAGCSVQVDGATSKGDSQTCFSNTNKQKRSWKFCVAGKSADQAESKPPRPSTHRQPFNYGPARQAFQAPFIIIVGTASDAASNHAQLDTIAATALTAADLLSAGRYISAGHMAASSTVAPVVTDIAAAASLSALLHKRLNLILVGGPDVNIISKMISNLHDGSSYVFPMEFHTPSKPATANWTSTGGKTGQSSESKGLRFSFRGSCTFEAKDQGAMFTFPIPHPSTFHRLEEKVDKNLGDDRKLSDDSLKNHMGIMIAASSKTSLIDAISFSFSSNQALTRAPFSNMYADYFVTGPNFRSRGLGGLQAAGFWNNRWAHDSAQGWTSIDC